MRSPRNADQREEREHDAGADEAELLADHGEDEVGVRRRQVVHLLLALPEPDAPTARPSRRR